MASPSPSPSVNFHDTGASPLTKANANANATRDNNNSNDNKDNKDRGRGASTSCWEWVGRRYSSDLSKESICDMVAAQNIIRHGWAQLGLSVTVTKSETSPTSTSVSIPSISVRRNIVADANDDQMYLSFAIKHSGYNQDKGILDVDMCLLEMEEDEVEDYGGQFPLSLESGDESLLQCISTEISGRAVIVHIQNKASANGVKEVKVEEKVQTFLLESTLIGGSATFSINEKAVLSMAAKAKGNSEARTRTSLSKLVKYVFCHIPTGATMEIRSPLMPILQWQWKKMKGQSHLSFFAGNSPMSASTDSKKRAKSNGVATHPSISNNVDVEAKGRKKKKKASFGLDSDTSDDDGMQDEYEDDGFIVFGSQAEEDSSVGSDDNDVCEICKQGGELVVCDGGVHRGGCGSAFHVTCIKREEIPDGELSCFVSLRIVGRGWFLSLTLILRICFFYQT